MALPALEQTYEIEVNDKPVRFIITLLFREGIAVTTFAPVGWTPKDLDMHTSLSLAREIAERFKLDVSATHEAVIRVLRAPDGDEEFDFDTKEGLLAGFRESWRQAMEGETRPIAELWDEIEDE